MRNRGWVGLAAVVLLIALGVNPTGAQELVGPSLPAPPGEPEVIPDQFIVELKHGVAKDGFIKEHRLDDFHRYTLINGFAARMSKEKAARLAGDARVESVSPDLVVHAFGKRPSGGDGTGGGTTTSGCPTTPPDGSLQVFVPEAQFGVRRIGADAALNTGAGVKVAVIDTGIDYCHPDLKDNYKGGKNLLQSAPPKDDNGHGTHVAGIIAARKNGFGVVGVAWEAHLYAVKVLDKDGSGSLSTVIKGLDWAAANGMKVANLSLGAFDLSLGSGSMCKSVTNAVGKGVTVVAAAGNAASETLFFTPANCAHSLTVSAFVDLNGLVDTRPVTERLFVDITVGSTVIREYDDTFAQSFSNYSNYCWDLNGNGVCDNGDALVVELMAPGVEVLSTMPTYTVTLNDPDGANKSLNYDKLTGTSMSAPHTAGAAALYIQANPGATPAQVRTALTIGAFNGECVAGSLPPGSPGFPLACSLPWPDDPDFAWEPLVDAGGL